jgi:hypothetical protein
MAGGLTKCSTIFPPKLAVVDYLTQTAMLRTVTATQYVTPLREGGSLPAIVEGDDDGTYVLKFRGAGQGHRALIAELIAGEIGRLIGLRVPEIVFAEVDPRMARTEPDPEIQDLLRSSVGLNLALDYLPGSIMFDPAVPQIVAGDEKMVSSIVWFDAFVTNVDRTPRNTNLLIWHRKLWCIDHGASLYFHHSWHNVQENSRARFTAIKDHVLLPWAPRIAEVDESLVETVTRERIMRIVDLIPDGWLGDVPEFQSIAAHRAAYADWLMKRLEAPREWVEEAVRARTVLV